MSDVIKILQDVMSLTKTVGALENDIEKLSEKSDEHTERIIRLELREESIQDKVTIRAITAVNEMNGKIFEKLAFHERSLDSINDKLKSLPQ